MNDLWHIHTIEFHITAWINFTECKENMPKMKEYMMRFSLHKENLKNRSKLEINTFGTRGMREASRELVI